MKAIVIAFTLKNQDPMGILATLETIKELEPDAILIHGFLPRQVVLHKQLPMDVVNALEEHFPIQLNMWKEVPLRDEMAVVAKRLKAQVYVIGDIREGVRDEVDLYRSQGLNIVHFPLPKVS